MFSNYNSNIAVQFLIISSELKTQNDLYNVVKLKPNDKNPSRTLNALMYFDSMAIFHKLNSLISNARRWIYRFIISLDYGAFLL